MEKIIPSLVEESLKIAVTAHAGQVRKSDGSPYIVHPVMVARMLDTAGFPEIVVAAALVHDVLEDTAVTEDMLRTALGDAVVAIVCAVSEEKELPWEARKQKYIERVVASGEAGMAVSVADKIHNAESLLFAATTMGPDVWSVFNRGKAQKMWFEESLYNALVPHFKYPLMERYQECIAMMASLPE